MPCAAPAGICNATFPWTSLPVPWNFKVADWIGSLAIFACVRLTVPLPMGFNSEPRSATFADNVPETGACEPAACANSATSSCDAFNATSTGLVLLNDQLLNPALTLKDTLPRFPGCNSPLLNLTVDGLASTFARSKR